MKRKVVAALLAVCMLGGTVGFSTGEKVKAQEAHRETVLPKSTLGNPILGFDEEGKTIYGGDPSVLVDGDTVYVYAGHDTSTGDGYVMPDYLCYSSKDMKEWKSEGTVMSMQDVTWGDKNTAWASQVMKHGGKYYLYYCSTNNKDNNIQSIGVAVADHPTGPFKDIGKALVNGSLTTSPSNVTSWNDIDPTAWIEKDEKGEEHRYLAWGNTNCYLCELNEDMVSVKDLNGDGEIKMTDDIKQQNFTGMPETYTEAPYLYRRQDEKGNYYGKYYLFYAMNWREEMAYATKDNLMEDTWTYGGRIMEPTATSNTNHPAIFDFKGKTYFIYHNGSLAWGSGYRRSVCVEELKFNEDGSIAEIQETATGVSGTSCQIFDYTDTPIAHQAFHNTKEDKEYPITADVLFDENAVKEDASWRLVSGKADKEKEAYVSIESYNKPGLYLKAEESGKMVLTQDADQSDENGVTKDAKSMTFRSLEGFAGYGVTLESVKYPGKYLVSERGKLVLSEKPDIDQCTFTTNLPKKITRIKTEKTKRTYLTGDKFTANDIRVFAFYEDGTSKKVSGFITNGSQIDTKKAGKKNLIVSYTEKEITKTVVVPIIVENKPVGKKTAVVSKSVKRAVTRKNTVYSMGELNYTVANPVASYDFNGTMGDGTEAVTKGLETYSDKVVYKTGRSGEEGDQAVQLGEYGLKLNHKNIGENYTVSCWLNPEQNVAANTPALFLGNDTPEQWVAVSGDSSDTFKVWTNETKDSQFNWKMVTSLTIPAAKWSMVTLTQSGNELKAYVNGNLIGSGTASKALAGENQDIYLGVSKWDPAFTGLVDDTVIYDKVLNGEEVRKLYDGKSGEDIFAQEGFKVTESMNLREGASSKIKVSVSSAITNAEKTFTSEDVSVATVDTNGEVTAVKAGSTNIITKIKVGKIEKTAMTKVTVTKTEQNVNKEVAVEYSMQGANNGKLVDKSGHGNDATIHNPENVTFITENDRDIMNITSDKSYLDLPMGIIDSLSDKEAFTIETTYARSASAGSTSWLFCLGSKAKATGTNYMFYCPRFNDGALRAGIKNADSEKLFTTFMQNQNEKYYTVDMVFSKGTVNLYVDGVKVGEEIASGYSIEKDIIEEGTTDNILGYIGKSCWSGDKNFVGKIASFKVYNKAMTEEEIQTSDPSYQQALQDTVDENLTEKEILGTKNPSLSEVSYDLIFPATVQGMRVVWESSNTDVISTTGVVLNAATDQKVTLKAIVTAGVLKATKNFDVTVKALDKKELESILKQAKTLLGSNYITGDSKKELTRAIERAEKVSSQMEVATAASALKKVINRVAYKPEYTDPFQYIEGREPVAKKELKVKQSQKLFTLPATIKNMVNVSYRSSNTSVASYTNGIVTAKKEGYAVVTVVVKAKSDGFAMEYSTLVTVKAQDKKPVVDLSKVKVVAERTKLAKGEKTKIKVSYPKEVKAAKPRITYKAHGAVKVDAKGNVTAKKAGAGSVKVMVTVNGKSTSKSVNFSVGEIIGKASLKVKKTMTLKVKGIKGKVKWSVSNKKYATISDKGVLKAKKAGKVVVTVKGSGVTIKRTIVIKK